MTNQNQEAKAKLKAQMCGMIAVYYEEFEKNSNEPDFDINRIEQLMLKQRAETHEILLAANEELSSSLKEADKKTAPSAANQ